MPHEQDIAAIKKKTLTLTRASSYISRHKSLVLPGEHVFMLGKILREITGKMNLQDSEAVFNGFVKCSSGCVAERDKIRKLANEKQSCC